LRRRTRFAAEASGARRRPPVDADGGAAAWAWPCAASLSQPTFLPEDYPADFSFFFDTTGRRTCYIAPERFYLVDSADQAPKQVRPHSPLL